MPQRKQSSVGPDVPAGPRLVSLLETTRPLTMFPVRLATRFYRPRDGAKPTELWVRIFPDLFHADGHFPALSAEEIAIGRTYWEKIWRAGLDPAARDQAHNWMVSLLGLGRAAWVAQSNAPTNPGDAPRQPVPVDTPLVPAPKYPTVKPRTESRPTVARLLPDRWCVIMRRTVEFVERVWSEPVRRDLAMAPNLADFDADGGIREMLKSQDLWWMVDFDEAVAAGMAVKVPWDRSISDDVSELVVFGVRGDNTDADDELERVLDAHRFTEGLEFVPQGTPTNNTDTVEAGFTEVPDDLEAYFERHLDDPRVSRPALQPASRLGTATAANATSIALGLVGLNALDRTEHAGLRYGNWARDMNRALWPGTIGYFLSRMLATGYQAPIGDADLGWLHDWFRDWVRGPGFLPSLRVGSQPYGLLPVARRPVWGDELGDARVDGLNDFLRDIKEWDDSLGAVAHFSHADSDPPPTPEEEAARLAAVLGAVPHPTAFRLRATNDKHDEVSERWAAEIDTLDDLLDQTPDTLHGQEYEAELEEPIKEGTVDEQSSKLARLRDLAQDLADSPVGYEEEALAVRDHVDGVLRPMTAAHKIRSETRRLDGDFSDAHLPTADDPPLWYVEYGDDGAREDGSYPSLLLVPDDDDPATTAATFRALADSARAAAGIPRPSFLHYQPASLIKKLVEHGIENVDSSATEELALGLEGLAEMIESGGLADPIADLERLLRETVGLATHRYDAWASSVAAEKLASLRAKEPGGLQIGAYGWVEALSPDEHAGADSQGFIHAPSLDHAATAAVLRSAWMAYASDALDAPFGIDLSSERVRRATWLLEGMRNGVDLAELLGARFERRLHDNGLSHLIADVRELVLAAANHAERPASAIVDGLAIAVAYSESTVGDPLYDSVEAMRATLPAGEGKALLVQLQDTVADLDSTADLLTAQAVHSVAKGNLPEAAATLSVAGAGDSGIPQLRIPSVHRESQVINHRIVAVFPAVASSIASPSLLALAEPTLAAWARSQLPDLANVPVLVELGDGGIDGRWQTRLADTGLSAIEVVAMAAVGGDLAASRLGALLAARARFETGAPADGGVSFVDTDAEGAVPLSDLCVAAGALRSAMGTARPLRGNDLSDSTEVEQDVDVEELDARRLALADALADLASQPADETLFAEHFVDLAVLDPEGLVAALSSAESRTARIKALLARAKRAAKALRAPLPREQQGREPQAQADYLAKRISDALLLEVPILAHHTPGNGADLSAAFSASRRRIGSPTRAMSWLLEVGRVHQGAGQCSEALDLVESINPNASSAFQAAQIPHVAGEPWVAVAAPSGRGSRLHLFSVTDAAAALQAGPVAGLLFDGWTEPVPGGKATTGVAIHFDRPGAQPPQAILLALPPGEGDWTVDEIETTLFQTLQLARTRAVGPETLFSWGHTLPGVYLPADVEVAILEDEEGAAP